MYYCWKCRKWHRTGKIAQKHKVFSAKKVRPGRPNLSSFRPKIKRTQPTPKAVKKLRQRVPVLIVKPKRKLVSTKPSKVKNELKQPRGGLSLMRRGQLAMRPEDHYESQMVKRLRRDTGMTHVQVMNLVNLAKKDDYIDVETEISGVAGESRDKTEIYEFAKRRIIKKLKRAQSPTDRYSLMSKKEIDFEEFKYADMQKNWWEELKRKQKIGMVDLI